MNNSRSYRSYFSNGVKNQETNSVNKNVNNYFFPFVLLITFFVVAGLFYQLIYTFLDQRNVNEENKAKIVLEKGTASVTPFGEKNTIKVHDGFSLLSGDSVQVGNNSEISIGFPSGIALRFAENTSFLIEEKDENILNLRIQDGKVWYFPPREPQPFLNVKISGGLVSVETQSSTEFDFSSSGTDSVRVYNGELKFNVLQQKSTEIIKTFVVGVGQEMSISDKEIETIKTGYSLNLLKAISDSFKQSEWYLNNTKNDPRLNFMVKEAISSNPDEKVLPKNEEIKGENLGSGEILTPPLITVPKSPLHTAEKQVRITGTVDKKVVKITVDHINSNQVYTHILSRFKPESGVFTYTAVAGTDSNLKEGENKYIVTGYDKEGNSTKKTELLIYYYLGAIPQNVSPAPTISASATPSLPPATATPQSSPTISPTASLNPSSLEIPKVLSFNGKTDTKTKEDSVKVEGTCDSKSVRVFVNGFALSGYRPNETNWVYYASKKYDTLKDGENLYRVYSVSESGEKSPSLEFKITKE